MNLSELRTSARERADEESDGFIKNLELDRYINQGQRHIYAQIVQRFEDYYIKPGSTLDGGMFDTVRDVQLYNLPADMHKLVRVEMRSSTSNSDRDFYRIRRDNIANYDFSSRAIYRPTASFRFGYYIAGNQIGFRPIPSSPNTVRLWYVPSPPVMVADGDFPVIPALYHDLIAEYAAIKCLSKSGEGIYKEKWAEFTLELSNLVETIENRDQQPEQMSFTEDAEGDLWEARFPWSD